jgi:hypothetical protein
MSICKICAANGKEGVQITWSEKVKSAHTGKLIPLETDGSTFHKHYEPTATTTTTNESPATKTETNAGAKWVRSITDSKLDNLAVVKAIAAALNEYIAIKEAGQ